MARESVAKAAKGDASVRNVAPYPKLLDGVESCVVGLFGILLRDDDLGRFSDAELATLSNQCDNMAAALINAVGATGDLLSTHNNDSSSIDSLACGWTVSHLADQLRAVRDAKETIDLALAARGFSRDVTLARQCATRSA